MTVLLLLFESIGLLLLRDASKISGAGIMYYRVRCPFSTPFRLAMFPILHPVQK